MNYTFIVLLLVFAMITWSVGAHLIIFLGPAKLQIAMYLSYDRIEALPVV